MIITSDQTVNYAGEMHLDSREAGFKRVAVAFTSTSISPGGDGQDQTANDQAVLSAHTSLKFVNQQRGFMLCNVTKDTWEKFGRVLVKVFEPDGKRMGRLRPGPPPV